MDYLVKEHGEAWWMEQGVKCPDCNFDDFFISDQSYTIWMKSYVVETHNDVEYKADMRCRNCKCAWTVSIKVKNAVEKESRVLRSVS